MNNVLTYSMMRQRFNKIPKWRYFVRKRYISNMNTIKLDIHNQNFDDLTADFFGFLISLNGDDDKIKDYVTQITFNKYHMKVELNDAVHTMVTYSPIRHNYMYETDDLAFTVDAKTHMNHISSLAWQAYTVCVRSIYIRNIDQIVDEYLF